MPFEAEQVYSTEPPGFIWLAKARVAPPVHLMARDKFVDGKGNMLIRMLGLVTVADGRGPEMDQGAGLRYWSEVIALGADAGSPAPQCAFWPSQAPSTSIFSFSVDENAPPADNPDGLATFASGRAGHLFRAPRPRFGTSWGARRAPRSGRP
jgi:hypothetical protein